MCVRKERICTRSMFTHQRGFTLIELLVVIAIIGILSSVVFASLGSARDRARVAAAQTELKQIQVALELLLDDTNQYPTGATESLCQHVNNAEDGQEITLNNSSDVWSYMTYTRDPWGNNYQIDEDYQCGANTTGCNGVDDSDPVWSGVIHSNGPNGVQNYGDGDDIVLVTCKGSWGSSN